MVILLKFFGNLIEMINTSLSSWPCFSQQEADAVQSVLLSNKVNYWTGNEGRLFEQEFAKYTDCKYAIALSNGTVALELALHCLGISDGDEVIVTPRTFLASVSAIVLCGATPIFAEVDIDSQNITAETISTVITPQTKAIIAVHLAGWPCDMEPIMALANKYNIKVIEDCAQAHGAKYKGCSVGSLSHVAAWSFCQDKIMTTGGEGGMITTNDKQLWKKIWAFKDHGKSYDTVYHKEHEAGFRWLHESFGTNGRMTEMQAAIGRIQLNHLSDWKAVRTQNANILLSCCESFPNALRIPRHSKFISHAWYKYYVFVRPEGLKVGWNRDKIINEITKKGIPCFSGSCSEVYLEKAFNKTNYRPLQRLPIAKILGETSLMFLIHPTLTSNDINMMCSTIYSVMSSASIDDI